jgi:hypothetical protein
MRKYFMYYNRHVFFSADICVWRIKPAFKYICIFTCSALIQHPVSFSHLHYVKSSLLLPSRTGRSVQLVNVLRAEFFRNSITEWRNYVSCGYFVARCFLECLDTLMHTCEFRCPFIFVKSFILSTNHNHWYAWLYNDDNKS